jgi:hypothetical protein
LRAALERLNPALPPEAIFEWKRIEREDEPRRVSLEVMLRGTCDRARLLDLVENFTLFSEHKAGLVKIVGQNHQYLGVNNTIASMLVARTMGHGRGGVFWQTQGSGKSYSMVFFAQKVLRKVPGNWTFVIGTDRVELDDQIATTFKATGAVSQAEGDQCHATSGAHLRELLRGNHRYVFTLIHKFQPERCSAGVPPAGSKSVPLVGSGGETPLELAAGDGCATMPVLCDRPDVIVLTDEAHRSQYDTLALNMRAALPKALFLAFTGTPLIAGEERTKDVFGDYVSIYDFQQSVEDGATVPLFYENRTPELQLVNPDLNEDIYNLIEAAELDPEQEAKLERELSRQYHILTRDDRLETVAQDIVRHFLGRGFVGKAMVVSIDKATALKMHDKVRKYWAAELARVEREIAELTRYRVAADVRRLKSKSPEKSEPPLDGASNFPGGRLAFLRYGPSACQPRSRFGFAEDVAHDVRRGRGRRAATGCAGVEQNASLAEPGCFAVAEFHIAGGTRLDLGRQFHGAVGQHGQVKVHLRVGHLLGRVGRRRVRREVDDQAHLLVGDRVDGLARVRHAGARDHRLAGAQRDALAEQIDRLIHFVEGLRGAEISQGFGQGLRRVSLGFERLSIEVGDAVLGDLHLENGGLEASGGNLRGRSHGRRHHSRRHAARKAASGANRPRARRQAAGPRPAVGGLRCRHWRLRRHLLDHRLRGSRWPGLLRPETRWHGTEGRHDHKCAGRDGPRSRCDTGSEVRGA